MRARCDARSAPAHLSPSSSRLRPRRCSRSRARSTFALAAREELGVWRALRRASGASSAGRVDACAIEEGMGGPLCPRSSDRIGTDEVNRCPEDQPPVSEPVIYLAEYVRSSGCADEVACCADEVAVAGAVRSGSVKAAASRVERMISASRPSVRTRTVAVLNPGSCARAVPAAQNQINSAKTANWERVVPQCRSEGRCMGGFHVDILCASAGANQLPFEK